MTTSQKMEASGCGRSSTAAQTGTVGDRPELRGGQLLRRGHLVWCILIFLSSWLMPCPTLAQEAPETAHSYTFGQSAEFTLRFPPAAAVEEVQLFLRIAGAVPEIHILTVKDGVARYHRDLRAQPFLPFQQITYWWEYEGGDGAPVETTETTFLNEDNRFRWQTRTDGELTIKWVSGSTELLVAALDIARTSLEEITTSLHSPSLGPVTIYIYPSLPDLQLALRLSGYEWLGGEAIPEVGVILLAIPPTPEAIIQLQQDIPHELTHLTLYRQLGPQGYANLPCWLNEGLAVHFEQRPEAAYALALKRARQENTLLPLADLCPPFYTLRGEQVLLAYAESQSATGYLQQTYGWSGMRVLLDAYADGLDCSSGLKRAVGAELPTVERAWRVWLEQEGQPTEQPQRIWIMGHIALRDLAPWLLLTLVIVLPGVWFFIAARPTSHPPSSE